MVIQLVERDSLSHLREIGMYAVMTLVLGRYKRKRKGHKEGGMVPLGEGRGDLDECIWSCSRIGG